MTFKNFLDNIVKESGANKLYNLPEPQIVNTVREIIKKYSLGTHQLTVLQLDDIAKKVIDAFVANTIDTISPYYLNMAAYCLWNKEIMLSKNRLFFDYYVNLINTKPRVRSSILSAYFLDFNPDNETFRRVENKFKEYYENINNNDRWSNLHTNKKIVNNNESIQRIAEEYLNSSESVLDFWNNLGLSSQKFLTGNFISHTFDKILDIYANNPSQDYLERIIEWAEPAEEELLYDYKRKITIEKLCQPWIPQDGSNKQIKTTTLSFFERNFGDLRTQSNRERYWGDINQESKNLVKKWIAGQTLEFFFKLISESALDRHWDYRERFWSSYYEDGLIDDAYVILGREALESINTMTKEDKPSNYGSFLSGSDVLRNHSVLLIEISNLTIVEWSHNGAMLFYLSDNNKKPLLNKTSAEYSSLELRNSDYDERVVHQNSEDGYWQDGAAEIIEGYTSIQMPRERYLL